MGGHGSGGMFTSPFTEHIALWEGVVRETIGAVTAPSHLAYGIETGEGCRPPGIGTYTTAEKVSFWPHQELCGTIVELLYINNVGHIRGVAPEGSFVNVRQRHDHSVIVEATTSHNFLKDGTRADVARDILSTLGQAGHEALATGIIEPRPEGKQGR